MFNEGGIVRFEGAATFSENEALVSVEKLTKKTLFAFVGF